MQEHPSVIAVSANTDPEQGIAIDSTEVERTTPICSAVLLRIRQIIGTKHMLVGIYMQPRYGWSSSKLPEPLKYELAGVLLPSVVFA
jgi:hypothetical protein